MSLSRSCHFSAWGDRRAALLLVGSGLYLIGTILLTIGYHVPLNSVLAQVDPAAADAASRWISYVRRWTAWNQVRALPALAAAALFARALTSKPGVRAVRRRASR